MNFSQAFDLVKTGTTSIRRAGWNGPGQHVYLEDSLGFTIGDGVFKGHKRVYKPVLVLFNSQQEHQPGWLPSMGDLMAEDWEVATHD